MPPAATAVRVALVFAGLSPFLPPLTEGVPVLEWVGAGLDLWFSYQCHREPGRSLHAFGELLPVCMRCLGIYVGLGLGGLILRPRLSVLALRLWVGLAALLMVADVVTYWLGWHPDWAASRLVTGLFLSYPVGIALVQAIRGEKV